MTDFSKLTPEQLEKMDKQVLITIIGVLQGQLNSISSQINFLTEQIALMNQCTFGRKTEKKDSFYDDAFDKYYPHLFQKMFEYSIIFQKNEDNNSIRISRIMYI